MIHYLAPKNQHSHQLVHSILTHYQLICHQLQSPLKSHTRAIFNSSIVQAVANQLQIIQATMLPTNQIHKLTLTHPLQWKDSVNMLIKIGWEKGIKWGQLARQMTPTLQNPLIGHTDKYPTGQYQSKRQSLQHNSQSIPNQYILSQPHLLALSTIKRNLLNWKHDWRRMTLKRQLNNLDSAVLEILRDLDIVQSDSQTDSKWTNSHLDYQRSRNPQNNQTTVTEDLSKSYNDSTMQQRNEESFGINHPLVSLEEQEKRLRDQTYQSVAPVRLLFHCLSILILLVFRPEQLHSFLSSMIYLMERLPHLVNRCVDFLIELMTTLQEGLIKLPASLETFVSSQLLNSLMAVCRYLLQKDVSKQRMSIDSVHEINYPWPPCRTLKLLTLQHLVFTFDFASLRSTEPTDAFVTERSGLIIPTKFSKYANYFEYQVWLQNITNLQLYEHIFHKFQNTAIRVKIINILGDMLRIHLRYFKQLQRYRNHIENVIVIFNSILCMLCEWHHANYAIAEAVASNLLKILNSSVVNSFFQIGTAIKQALLDSVARFMRQVIIEQNLLCCQLIGQLAEFCNQMLLKTRLAQEQLFEDYVHKTCSTIAYNLQSAYYTALVQPLKNSLAPKINSLNAYLTPNVSEFISNPISISFFEQLSYQSLIDLTKPFSFYKPRNQPEILREITKDCLIKRLLGIMLKCKIRRVM